MKHKHIAKTLSINGNDVHVRHRAHVKDHGVVEIFAVVGDVTLRHRHTFGSTNAPIPAHYDTAEMQKEIDKQTRKLAEMAESKHRIGLMLKEVYGAGK